MNLTVEVPVGMIRVPQPISLSGGWLAWRVGRVRCVRPPAGLLQKFINLRTPLDMLDLDKDDYGMLQKLEADGGPGILAFAREWGVLEICEHLRPATHSNDCAPMRLLGVKGEYREPLEAWYSYAGLFRSIIRIAAHVRQTQVGSDFDWSCILEHPRFNSIEWLRLPSNDVAVHRERLMLVVNLLLSEASVKPVLQFDSNRFKINFVGGLAIVCGLFGHLVTELMFAVAVSQRWYFCSECGVVYSPKRTPNPHRKNYCDECRHNANWRNAARTRRKRKADPQPAANSR